MDENGIIDEIEELARRFGKTVRTVYRWRRAGMPVRPDGRFDFYEITAWRRVKRGSALPGTALPGTEQVGGVAGGAVSQVPTAPIGAKDLWDAESKKYQAKMRELDFRKRQGELIERKENEERNIRRILEVKDLLLSFESLLPPELIRCRTDREMSDVIRKFTRKALHKFVKHFENEVKGLVDAADQVNG